MSAPPEHHPPDDLDTAAVAYAQRWNSADTDRRALLRHDLICRCLPFADRMARRYRGRPEPMDDLRQVARLGLIKSIDRYDPARGSFSAFAVITIAGEINRHVRDRPGGLQADRRMQDLIRRLGPAGAELTHTLGRPPSTAELAAHLRRPEDEVRHARLCATGPTPLPPSTTVDGDGPAPRDPADLAGGTDESMAILPDRLAVIALVRTLPGRIQRIIVWRFYGNRTQAQIAAELGISQMHVSRLLRQALAWLRDAMLSDVPPPWTGQEEAHPVESLRVDIRQQDGAVLVQVRGEIDRDTADRLRYRLHAAVSLAGPGPLVVDVAGVPMVDAAGAAVLRDAFVSGALSDVDVRFTGLQPQVAAVLALLGLPAVPTSARRPATRPGNGDAGPVTRSLR